MFFTTFLLFYYLVFAYRDTSRLFWAEPVLIIWIVSFACRISADCAKRII